MSKIDYELLKTLFELMIQKNRSLNEIYFFAGKFAFHTGLMILL